MCPKMMETKKKITLMSNSSMVDRIKFKFAGLHRITIAAVILYILFVIMFVIVNVLMCIWNVKTNRRRYFHAGKNSFLLNVKIDLVFLQIRKPIERVSRTKKFLL